MRGRVGRLRRVRRDRRRRPGRYRWRLLHIGLCRTGRRLRTGLPSRTRREVLQGGRGSGLTGGRTGTRGRNGAAWIDDPFHIIAGRTRTGSDRGVGVSRTCRNLYLRRIRIRGAAHEGERTRRQRRAAAARIGLRGEIGLAREAFRRERSRTSATLPVASVSTIKIAARRRHIVAIRPKPARQAAETDGQVSATRDSTSATYRRDDGTAAGITGRRRKVLVERRNLRSPTGQVRLPTPHQHVHRVGADGLVGGGDVGQASNRAPVGSTRNGDVTWERLVAAGHREVAGKLIAGRGGIERAAQAGRGRTKFVDDVLRAACDYKNALTGRGRRGDVLHRPAAEGAEET